MSNKHQIQCTSLNMESDRAGNLLLAPNGSIAVYIPPIRIRITVMDEEDKIIGRLEGTAVNLTFRGNAYDWIHTANKYWSYRKRGSIIELGSNLREFSSSIMSFGIYAGVDIYKNEYMTMNVEIDWGEGHIYSKDYYACYKENKTYYLGNVSINLDTLTLTYTESSSTNNRDCANVIEAPYRWCSAIDSIVRDPPELPSVIQHLRSRSAYTQSLSPRIGEIAYATEIQEDDGSGSVSTVGTISQVSSNEYIIVEDGTRYWYEGPSKEESHKQSYIPKPCMLVSTDNVDVSKPYPSYVEYIYVEHSYGMQPTGSVYKEAIRDSRPDMATAEKYPDEEIAKDLQWEEVSVITLYYDKHTPLTVSKILQRSGGKITSGDHAFLEFKALDPTYTTPVWVRFNTTSGSDYNSWRCDIVYYGSFNTAQDFNNADKYDSDHIGRGNAHAVKYNGKYYYEMTAGFYVFHINTYHEWKVSCDIRVLELVGGSLPDNDPEYEAVMDERRVYTKSKDMTYTEYYDKDLNLLGNIRATGTDTYSIVVDGGTYYTEKGYTPQPSAAFE